ncbi:MAG: uridine diphosphate-N-acetylglucosamine-binding protein YvcK [Candidatus Pacebacteria bacterium]|nr:uridine diphosphate-N-acetylglucosamine-binding protein YvcK [Candidatus Paceibacterota bacterium]MDD5012786.1 uridine diphosphate-N-acetylglucosamine-binding protein YvcK [Candidatus Paceibacterota bacterium]MDD5752836.1 uridine diphosphate-N-acetylglucosamine-binding protein YvcK [Candidatus Paceibacterota bacterium]
MFRSPFVKKTKKIVCIGGGNAMPNTVLRGLKDKDVELTVVSCVLDSGGSSGRLRSDYNIISPGDLRRAFIELANLSFEDKELLNYRFKEGELKGHNLGNIIFSAMVLNKGGYKEIFERLNDFLGKHKILPSTIHNADLVAVLENKEEIVGETNIDIPKHNSSLKIDKIFLRPEVNVCPQTVKRLGVADAVIIGPGDIYSSLMQVLLVNGACEAIKASKAKKIYIPNLMNKNGESNGFKVEDFVNVVENRLQCPLDYVIFNNKNVSEERLKEYKEEHEELLDLVECNSLDKKFIGEDIVLRSGDIVHDPEKLAKIIMKLICKQ